MLVVKELVSAVYNAPIAVVPPMTRKTLRTGAAAEEMDVAAAAAAAAAAARVIRKWVTMEGAAMDVAAARPTRIKVSKEDAVDVVAVRVAAAA